MDALFRNLVEGKTQTVVVYGTSLSHTAAWTGALAAYFETRFPGQVTVINSAMSGQHSHWGLAHLEERVLSKDPDLVFLEFSINDSATKHHISPEQSARNLADMVRRIQERNPHVEIVLQTMNPVWDAPDEPQGKKSATDRPNLATYYEIYRNYAHEHNIPLIDHDAKWRQLYEEDEDRFWRWLPDGTHPIPEASLAVTWAAIKERLEKARHNAVARVSENI